MTVERFARWWIGKTVAERKAEPLLAGWNPGKTYFSGFHKLDYQPDVFGVDMKIFVGTAHTIIEHRSGFAIVLKERQDGGPELRVWVSRSCLALGAEGAALEKRLQKYANTRDWTDWVEVYALESFKARERAGNPTLSLGLEHPHMIWIP